MFFSQKSSAQEANVFIQGQKFLVVSDFKYLGIILDSNLTFKKTC